MKTVKQLQEDIDALKYEAKGIYEACKRANREMNAEESARFDAITDEKNGEISVLAKQLKDAEDREQAIRDMAIRDRRNRVVDEIENSLVTTNPAPTASASGNAATANVRVLPRMSKLRAFKDDATAYDAGMWFRAVVGREYHREDKNAEVYCSRKGLTVTNVGNEGSGTGGGYLVPTPLAQTIIDVRESVGVARRILQIQPMTADTLSIPRRAGGLTVYYPGEATTITTSDKTWGQVELIARRRAVAHQISQDLVDDALISIVDDAVAEMAYALADKEDSECINGDGTATYGGVRGLLSKIGSAGVYTAGSGDDTWAELALEDFTGTMGKLPEKYSRAPVWVCSANFYWSVMVKVLAGAGGNNVASLTSGPNGEPMFLGYPVYFTDKMPRTTAASTKCAMFGTFSMGAMLGDRVGIRIGRSDDVGFLEDVTTLRATSRYDIQVHAPGDSSNAGAYVALSTNS